MASLDSIHSRLPVTRIGTVVAVAWMAMASVQAGTILGGIEDLSFSNASSDKDYNDLMFELTGSIGMVAPGGVYSNLTPGVASGHGNPYWDGQSQDGPNQNVGNCVLGSVACGLPHYGDTRYLSAAGGGSLLDIVFQAQGPITATLLGEFAGMANLNTLGWYDPEHAGILHQIFSGPMAAGTVITFNPSSRFVLYSNSGSGQFYSSQAAANQGEAGSAQHFALFQSAFDDPVSHLPEPGTMTLSATALLAGLLYARRRRSV